MIWYRGKRYVVATPHGVGIAEALGAFERGLREYEPGHWRGLCPDRNVDNEYAAEYRFEYCADAIDYAREVIALFDALPDPIVAYRGISLGPGAEVREPYGRHWSLDPDTARLLGWSNEPYMEDEEPTLQELASITLLRGEIPKQAVDWDETFAHWIVWSGDSSIEPEQEITVVHEDLIRNVTVV